MKKPRLSSRDSALFAVLMRDEHDSLPDYREDWGHPDLVEKGEYIAFLRSQSKHADANCPYRRAVALIEGRP